MNSGKFLRDYGYQNRLVSRLEMELSMNLTELLHVLAPYLDVSKPAVWLLIESW